MLVPAEVWNIVQREGDERPVVLLRPVGSEAALPIIIDGFQAASILLGLKNERIDQADRPHTHDLFIDVLTHLGAQLARIEITGIRGETYYGRLILTVPGREEVSVDSRPSDCIALAVRVKCPIYVDEDLVNEEGKVYHVDGENLTVAPTDVRELQLLKDRLRRAVEAENYEEAAKLRDTLKKMEGKPEGTDQ
jgi:bifunctional DNase/RNase